MSWVSVMKSSVSLSLFFSQLEIESGRRGGEGERIGGENREEARGRERERKAEGGKRGRVQGAGCRVQGTVVIAVAAPAPILEPGARPSHTPCQPVLVFRKERKSFLDNLLVQIHFIVEMMRWTGLAPWEFEFPFPGSLISTFL